MIDLIVCLCLLLFFIQICLFLFFGGFWNMLRSKMAALMAWLVGSITGRRGEEETSEENKQTSGSSKDKPKPEAKHQKTKTRHRAKKTSEEPTFNTNLSIPIETIIEETLSEEKSETQSSSSQAASETPATEKPATKPKKKKKPIKKEKVENKSDEEDIGFSFFKLKPVQVSQKENKTILETQVGETNSVEDNVGFSFFPVKEKNRKGKGKLLHEKENFEEPITAVTVQGIPQRSDSSRPSIIDHFKHQDLSVKKKGNSTHIAEKSQGFVFVNRVETKSDLKESKRVTSHISYASVVTNSVPENLNVEEEKTQNQKIATNETVQVQENLNKEVSSSIEVLSEYSEDLDVDTELAEEVSEITLLTNNKFEEFSKVDNKHINFENLEESNQPQCSDKREFTLEGSIEIIEKSLVDDQKNKETQSKEEDRSSIKETLNEGSVSLQEGLFQTVECSTEEFSDQVLDNIIEQLNLIENPNSKEDLPETFILKESGCTIIDLPEKLSKYSHNSLKDFESLESHQEIKGYNQPSQDLTAEEIVNIINIEEEPSSTSVFEPNFQNGYIEELNKVADLVEDVKKSSVEEQFEADKLSLSDEKIISELVEDFLKAEIQPELNPQLNLKVQEEAYKIADIKQIHSQQQKPVVEEPFIKKFAYITTQNQNKDNTTNLIVPHLDNQIIKEPLSVNEIHKGALNTEENLIAGTQFVQNIGKGHTEIQNESLAESLQALESLIIEDTKVNIHTTKEDQPKINQEEKHTVDFYVPQSSYDSQANIEEIIEKQTTKREIQNIEDSQFHTSFQEQVPPASHQAQSCIKSKQSTEYHHSLEESIFANMAQIRVLTLNDKEHQESTIYRIENNFILQFRLGPSLLGRKIKLYCNYPKETNGVLKEFDRGTYQLLNWCQDEGCKNADDTALFAQIVAKISGSFHFYFIYENADTEERQGSGYFLVDPVLKYGNNEELPLDCIQCQTVLAKQLGPFSTWENKLKVAKESGYNVIHFTPIQELGVSKSCYSLSEQLKLNSMFNEENAKNPTFEDIERLTTKMRKEWKVLSICDIVLNHTANESEWIKEHPEVTYNCVNCPYMRPAYLLDAALHQFSMDVKKGYYEDRGIPAEVSTEEHLKAIRYHFKTSILESVKIQELYMVDVSKYLENFLTLARKTPPVGDSEKESLEKITIIQDPEFRRLASTIDVNLALKVFNIYRLDCFDEESRVKRCAEDLKSRLDSLNEVIIKGVTDDLNAALDNVIAGIRYFRVQADGPKLKEITIGHPLVDRYFTDHGLPKSLKEHEEIMYSENGSLIMAHNGWVMNSDPLKNFASPGTKIYIRRELIAWGDSVKLRYGDSPEDSPFLWDYMRKYVEQTAKIFDGVRLDNCHSTPIPVAEYLLDAARKVRPDLYVVAELFTNSDLTDNIFVNRLGITSLIREAMSAWDSHEEGRLVYRYGGVPVGSFFQPNVRPLVPMVAHALFLDLTHDNPSPVEKRSVFDLLPSTALVNMACCASGSSRGYDELVPHHIHVVDETRQYTEWSEDESLAIGNVRFVNNKFGIIAAKRALNDLHFKLGKEGYNQVYVDQMDPDIVAVTRHNPETHTSYVLVAFTAFGHPDIHSGNFQRGIKPLRVEGVLDEIVLEASLSHIDEKSGGSRFTKFETFTKDSTWINGLSEYQVSLKQHIEVNQSDIFEEANSGTRNVFQLNFKNFKPGSIAVVRVSLPEDIKESVSKVRSLISNFSAKKDTDLKQIISRMSLSDLNRALYRCDQEERDEGNGFDVYNIPNFGPMVYCGLQGFMSLLANIRPNNDLGHPFCANLRDGNWLIEYIWKRLKVDEGTKELGQWIEENTKYLHTIPRYLIPSYFDVIVTGIYIHLLEQSYNLMSDFVKCGSTFVKGLSLGSLQFCGYVGSACLPELSPNLAPPKPPTRKNKNGETVQACVTLSAGLPHFAVGYMRNWGRDTFIALRGLLILTGRFEETRQHILGYGACLRHGLIPNLLDGGRNSRFNCRDALWWWLYCIKSYCEEAPNGTAILSDKVSRIFPTDDSAPQPAGTVDQPLHDVIQEALKVHFQGLKFRERNAGRQIDEQMTDAGFNNQIGIHPETGFVFGGNQWNSGTWMDKMGSSDKAGNKGKPATPRDGSAVELVGLSKAAVLWLWKLNQEGKYPYDGVERTHKNGAVTKWTFKEWSDKIQENFEKKFWIGSKPSSEESRPDLVNKKNIYKDLFGASQTWTDYQLRPNFTIAMVAAPEMFDPQHAWAALEQAEKYLLGPLGMRTLDPEDWNYRGDYDNSNDSNDFNISNGFNYHQGPEWVWPIGYFLRAKLIFAAQNGMLKETLASTKVILSRHFTELQTSPWRGLPELTNSNGSYCRDSSRTQAWSMSCILEVLHDLQQIESKQIIVN